ncbi:Uncharacterised protein [Bordetella pertussis]|nr:Uncharacterised protein [Bordetella pertussis]
MKPRGSGSWSPSSMPAVSCSSLLNRASTPRGRNLANTTGNVRCALSRSQSTPAINAAAMDT